MTKSDHTDLIRALHAIAEHVNDRDALTVRRAAELIATIHQGPPLMFDQWHVTRVGFPVEIQGRDPVTGDRLRYFCRTSAWSLTRHPDFQPEVELAHGEHDNNFTFGTSTDPEQFRALLASQGMTLGEQKTDND